MDSKVQRIITAIRARVTHVKAQKKFRHVNQNALLQSQADQVTLLLNQQTGLETSEATTIVLELGKGPLDRRANTTHVDRNCKGTRHHADR